MYTRITGENNPVLKKVNAVKVRKYREKYDVMFLEGFKLIREALISQMVPELIVLRDDPVVLEQFENELHTVDTKIYVVNDKLFGKISDTKNSQGIIGLISVKKLEINEMVLDSDNLFLIAEELNDPGNLGTIIRSADGAGFSAVILTSGCVDVYNPKTIRATMGSLFHIPVYHGTDIRQIVEFLKINNVRIYAADSKGSKEAYAYDLRKNIGLIIGNEARGISEDAVMCSDGIISIPMPGKAESLNASIAASIMMFESSRQRYMNGEEK